MNGGSALRRRDGCARGWVLAELAGGRPTGYRLCPDFTGVLEYVRGARLVLVDIPIGLPDAARPHRLCDLEARHELGRRGCCVFAAPTREVLEPSGWEEASALNRTLTGRGLSKQS